jgi:hypothetical protein
MTRGRRRAQDTALRLVEEASYRRPCDWPDCQATGEFRAPRSRERLRDFFYFCLDHVRLYNQSWDFFSGMSRDEIEQYLREDVTWHRPTWQMGVNGGTAGAGWRWQDSFGVFMNGDGIGGTHGASEWDRPAMREGRTERMLKVLDLDPGVGRDELKARYKQLVKKHHPDLHGGDKKAEERLKLINEAYTYLLDREQFA